MKKLTAFLATMVAALTIVIIVSCTDHRPVLHVYNWGDYMSQDVVEAFEKEYDCKVQIDTFDSNEAMYAKLQSGAGGYDVIVPSSYQAKMMNEEGMLEPIDMSKLPSVMKYFDKTYENMLLDKKLAYTVPYFVSITGIGYNSEKVKDFTPSWRMFEREDLKGKTALLDDNRELIGAALLTLGYNVNSTGEKQINEAVELIMKWKKNIAKFGVDDCKMSLASDEFYMIQTYSGDMLQVIAEKPHIKFVIPKEGSTITFDCLAIMKNSTNKELAHAFIDFIYRTENSVKNMNEIMYVMPHTEAIKLVDEDLKKNPAFGLSADDRAKCTPLDDLGEKKTLYDRAWDRVKSEDASSKK